jgi:hypothetical protein
LKTSFVVNLEHLTKLKSKKETPVEEQEFLASTCLALGLEAKKLDGNKWQLTNRKRLGSTEVEQAQLVINNVARLLTYEKLLAEGKSISEISALIEQRNDESCVSCVIC